MRSCSKVASYTILLFPVTGVSDRFSRGLTTKGTIFLAEGCSGESDMTMLKAEAVAMAIAKTRVRSMASIFAAKVLYTRKISGKKIFFM
jgi:hypothetical protein